MDAKLAKLMARNYYLTELKKVNLVTPSIGKSYPPHPVDEESMIIHNGLLKIQNIRTTKIRQRINEMKNNGILSCKHTLKSLKDRLKKRISFLKDKFKPIEKEQKRKGPKSNKKIKNKKSRERYEARNIRRKIRIYNEDINNGIRTIINLSSYRLCMAEIFALELGYGFVPTPSNPQKEEELLILEGMRFIDRIGKVDAKLREGVDTQVESTMQERKQTTQENGECFARSKNVPINLQFSQPKEEQLQNPNTKLLKKEFDEFNTNLINTFKTKKRRHNLPKKIREALYHLKKLVIEKVIDIRKVDKGQMVMVIDYSQRVKTESLHINEIASFSQEQSSNWKENKNEVEAKLKELHNLKFISDNELTAVTGLLVGGVSGKLKNRDGSVKFTRVKESNELFSQQNTPYIYPLFKLHKLPLETILQLQPNEVAEKIPSRLVVGMACCQLSRVQCWLETFLTPLAKLYGSFEYIKDSSDMLRNIELTKNELNSINTNWEEIILYTIDVKALYPSVKFPYLIKSLKDCFTNYTNWTEAQINILIKIILYTLENQQVKWDNKFYTLKQGIPTGAKHSVPLANIFLTFILKDLLQSNHNFRELFQNVILLWKRFIDDCGGMSKGNFQEFLNWYGILRDHFRKYELELTADTDLFTIEGDNCTEKESKYVTFLDIDIFKEGNNLHTKEHRKETSTTSYLKFNSAHPRYTFKGIIKSQLYRIRRLCSRDKEYKEACLSLKERCIASGYKPDVIEEIFNQSEFLPRNLDERTSVDNNDTHKIRLVTLAGTQYENQIYSFVSRMNRVLVNSKIKVEIVKTTGSSIAKILFNNNNTNNSMQDCGICFVCNNNNRNEREVVKSTVTGKSYKIANYLNCSNGGIYAVEGKCSDQYTGKTTVDFSNRMYEHLCKQKSSSVYKHNINCLQCNGIGDYKVSFIEDYRNRGKYTLSEREYLWNYRIKGIINGQKTLMN